MQPGLRLTPSAVLTDFCLLHVRRGSADIPGWALWPPAGSGQWAAREPEFQTVPDPVLPNSPVKGAKMPVTKLNFKLSSRATSLHPASATPSEILPLLQRIKAQRPSPRRFSLCWPQATLGSHLLPLALAGRGHQRPECQCPSSQPHLLGGGDGGHRGDGSVPPLMSNFLKTIETRFMYGLLFEAWLRRSGQGETSYR